MSEASIQLMISVLGAVATLVGTVWTVRGMLAKFDVKLAVIEEKLSSGEKRMARHSDKIEALEERMPTNGRLKPHTS